MTVSILPMSSQDVRVGIRSSRLHAALVGLIACVWTIGAGLVEPRSVAAEAEAAAHARPGETVGQLISRAERKATADSGEAGGFLALARLLGVAVLVVGSGLGLIWFWRRTPIGNGRRVNRGAVEVVGRAAISQKHSVALLKVGADRLIVVGISGESMTQLATIEGAEQVERLRRELESEEARVESQAERAPVARSSRGAWRDLLAVWSRNVSSVGTGGKR